jgi:flagellin-like protein
MKLGNLFSKDERGVSPVIGVILMVAITVILAAVIGTFVLGLGDQIGGSATAGVTVDGDGSGEVTVTLTNSGTADRVDVVDSSGNSVAGTGGVSGVPLENTGATATIDNSTLSGEYNIVAIGPDGETSVLRSFTLA